MDGQVYMGVANVVNISGVNDNPYDSLILSSVTPLLPGQVSASRLSAAPPPPPPRAAPRLILRHKLTAAHMAPCGPRRRVRPTAWGETGLCGAEHGALCRRKGGLVEMLSTAPARTRGGIQRPMQDGLSRLSRVSRLLCLLCLVSPDLSGLSGLALLTGLSGGT